MNPNTVNYYALNAARFGEALAAQAAQESQLAEQRRQIVSRRILPSIQNTPDIEPDHDEGPPRIRPVIAATSEPGFIYIVVQSEMENAKYEDTWNIKGVYKSVADANNQVLELWGQILNYWRELKQATGQDCKRGVGTDGRIWWTSPGANRSLVTAWVGKNQETNDSGAEEKQWGAIFPWEIEADENEEKPKKESNNEEESSSTLDDEVEDDEEPPIAPPIAATSEPGYTYIVILSETGGNAMDKSTWKIIGVYESAVDANNIVLSLWEQELFEDGRECMKGTNTDGRIWWRAPGFDGSDLKAWSEKKRILGYSGARQKQWGEIFPWKNQAERVADPIDPYLQTFGLS